VFHPYEEHRFVLNEVPQLENKRILDCGCGQGIWAYLMRCEKRGDEGYIVGLDLNEPFLAFCKKHRVYDDLVLSDTSRLPFRNKSFDMILASEVIEHLTKDQALKFLEEIERVCKRRIILTTPNGQRLWKAERNKWQIHRSIWTAREFQKRGYKVRGIGFKYVELAKKSPYLWGFFRYSFTPLAYMIPHVAELLVAVKDVALL